MRVFLCGLKLFDQIAQETGYYDYSNPLVDSMTVTMAELLRQLEADTDTSRMPAVAAPRRKQRLSDSYFKPQGED